MYVSYAAPTAHLSLGVSLIPLPLPYMSNGTGHLHHKYFFQKNGARRGHSMPGMTMSPSWLRASFFAVIAAAACGGDPAHDGTAGHANSGAGGSSAGFGGAG